MANDWLDAAEARLEEVLPFCSHCGLLEDSGLHGAAADCDPCCAPLDHHLFAAAPDAPRVTDLRRALAVCRAAEGVAADLEALSPQSPWVAAYAVDLRAALTGEEV